jgi:hypothetical protein
LAAQIADRGLHGLEMELRFTEVGDDTLVGSAAWVDRDGVRQERYHVLTIRDGRIADMQVCGSWRQAKRFARRARS